MIRWAATCRFSGLRIPDAKDDRGSVWRERMLAEILAACASARG